MEAESQGEDIPFWLITVEVFPNPRPGVPRDLAEQHQRGITDVIRGAFDGKSGPKKVFREISRLMDTARAAVGGHYWNILVYVCGRDARNRVLVREWYV